MVKRKKHPASAPELSQKEKGGLKKAGEGYFDIPYEDVLCMDETLAQIIAKHLRAFLKTIRESPYAPFPGEFAKGPEHKRGFNEWCNVLHKMIYAFEEYKREPDIGLNDDLDENARDGEATEGRKALEAERQKRIKEGMQLFIDYYERLWW